MPRRLHRYYGAGYLHFITTSCYQRRALLGRKQNRDLFLQVLEQVRRRYHFAMVGYVVMPEHVHLLLGEDAQTMSATRIIAVQWYGLVATLIAGLAKAPNLGQWTLGGAAQRWDSSNMLTGFKPLVHP